MNEFSGMLCLGSIFLAPVFTFVLGILVGRDKLPFKIRIERNEAVRYKVED